MPPGCCWGSFLGVLVILTTVWAVKADGDTLREESLDLALHRIQGGLQLFGGEDDSSMIRLQSSEASSTSKAEGASGANDYASVAALSRGSGYWCSAGGHGESEVIKYYFLAHSCLLLVFRLFHGLVA